MRSGLLLLALLAWWAGPALALSPAEVTRRLERDFGVEVLAVREAEMDGRRLYVVTVMFPEGNGNAAFQVGELWLDAESGEPVPRLVHRSEGYDLPPPRAGGGREPGVEVRRWTFEGPAPR